MSEPDRAALIADEVALHQRTQVWNYEHAKAANPFVEDSEPGQAWLLGALWGDEERQRLQAVIADLQLQMAKQGESDV